MNTGKKFDQDKPAMHLIPPVALTEEAKAMGFGEKKYGTYNYLGGMRWSRLVGAALRHITAWHSGEDLDPETSLNHLAHARCCLAILLAYQIHGLGEDDRFGNAMEKIKASASPTTSPQ